MPCCMLALITSQLFVSLLPLRKKRAILVQHNCTCCIAKLSVLGYFKPRDFFMTLVDSWDFESLLAY